MNSSEVCHCAPDLDEFKHLFFIRTERNKLYLITVGHSRTARWGARLSLLLQHWHSPLTFAAQLLEKKRMIMVTGKITLRPAPVSILTISVCFYYWRTLKKLRGAGANIILAYAACVSSREASPLSATKPVVGRRSTLGLWPGSCKIF